MAQDLITFTDGNGVSYSLNVTFAGSATSGAVTGITGTVGGHAVTDVSFDNSDQTVNASAPYVDASGVSFSANGVSYDYSYVTDAGGLLGALLGTNYTGYVITEKVNGFTTYLTANNPGVTTNVCYVEGTHILTERGEIAVEDLWIGDVAITASGARRPIKWLGHRRVDCRNHTRAYDALPVRISAHAFGPNKPHRDLCVSPGHSLCVDVIGEVLIRAHSLLNGTTIQQMDVDSVVYWHVELDSHDILLAENLPAESYFDMANRNFFVESGVVLIEMTPDAAAEGREAEFCRPLHTDGPVVSAVRAQLLAQAKVLGWTLETTPFNDLHLVVDGQRVDPVREGLCASFDVPAGAQDIRLVSITSKPCQLPNPNHDARPLGVPLKRLRVGEHEVALDDPRLQNGLHALEAHSWGSFRWTDGDTALPASLFEETAQDRRFRLDLLTAPLPFWVAPVASREAEAA